jgi:hypothetical protein
MKSSPFKPCITVEIVEDWNDKLLATHVTYVFLNLTFYEVFLYVGYSISVLVYREREDLKDRIHLL